ncbi:MAG: AAA family ATPase [Deltaproteobacteria bacterium]|nr:AAA family ATPase [Deltaproteobacteria bacterium]MBI3076068.1 AAA family ATPase [Deltaproteobacteria bacterium]
MRLLIGPNAAGKSNLIDALRLLHEAVDSDMETAVTRRGGLKGVVFLGANEQSFDIALEYFVPDPTAPHSRSDMSYLVRVAEKEGRPGLALEELRIKRNRNEPGAPKLWFRAEWGRGEALRDPGSERREAFETGDPGVVALKALGFLDAYPRIRALRTFIEGWQFLSVDLVSIREPQRDERATVLDSDAANLVNVLRTLQASDKQRHKQILDDVQSLLPYVEGITTPVERGLITLFMQERGFTDPLEALALSDGTLRLLAIITALETMSEHGLLCIEEPEHGLHPLLLGLLLDLFRERCPKSGSKQVLVTTHSPDLVDAAEIEEVLPVERDTKGTTQLLELDPAKTRKWLRDFRLGELWRMRQIGGVPS